MKKLMLFGAGMLMMATISFAQDSTNIKKTEPTTPTEAVPAPEDKMAPADAATKDMVKITSTDLPDAVKQTLGAPQYQGWESAPVYRSKNNDVYVIEMKNGTEAKTFRFGADGKPIIE